eukprot:GHVU01187512.1.p1 GENE.GHVU01187512.1~~GHVU01187512.1.p1  ORF type:complete len:123 (-),score=24.94 GHVU01187512.1:144-512(-)
MGQWGNGTMGQWDKGTMGQGGKGARRQGGKKARRQGGKKMMRGMCECVNVWMCVCRCNLLNHYKALDLIVEGNLAKQLSLSAVALPKPERIVSSYYTLGLSNHSSYSAQAMHGEGMSEWVSE